MGEAPEVHKRLKKKKIQAHVGLGDAGWDRLLADLDSAAGQTQAAQPCDRRHDPPSSGPALVP